MHATSRPRTNGSFILIASLGALTFGCDQKPQTNTPVQPPTANVTPAPTAPSTVTTEQSGLRTTSPLFQAIADHNTAEVEAALKAGEDPNEFLQDGNLGGYTVLHTAARVGHADILQLLIAHGGDVNVKAKAFHEATPLHWAARAKQFEAVKVLVEAGADVNAVLKSRDNPQTASQLAATLGSWEIVEYLRSKGGK